MNFGTLMRKTAAVYGDNLAVVCGDRRAGHAELYERSCRVAQALAGLGVQPGERVALLSDNCFEVPELKVGLAIGGYVRSGLYTQNAPDANRYLLELTETRALIAQRRHLDALAPALAGLDHLRHVIVLDDDGGDGQHGYAQLTAAASSEDPHVPVGPDDIHQIRFSAGTTGKPKGIAHTTRGWLAMGQELSFGMPPLGEDDRYLAAGPLTHAATMPFWPVLATGGAVVVMPAFDPAEMLALIERERCTLTLLVPTMIDMLVEHPDAGTRDLSSLRGVLYGASPITERTLKAALATWGNVMYQVYGQSEGAPATVLAPRDHRPDGDARERGRLRSAGRPLPYSLVSIVDDDGSDLPTGETGEIAILTPGMMHGIWNDPAATRARFLPDGRLLTRDVGSLDADGFLFLSDRKEDMIISGGFNIWPAELENALADHPAVASAAVVGVPHDRWGETPVAAVVLRDGADATEQELIDWTRERLGSVKKITAARFVDALPVSGVGKVLRRELRELWRD